MENIFGDGGGNLFPTRKNSGNAKVNTFSAHERSRSLASHESGLSRSNFEAVTLVATQIEESFTFTPVSAVLRAHIPFSWLCTTTSLRPPPGTLLRADITCVPRWDYNILIASHASNRALYAFERVDIDAYICHPLQSWVKLIWVEQAAFGAAPAVDLDLILGSQNGRVHARRTSTLSIASATEPLPTSLIPKIPKNRRGELARLSILEPKEKTTESSDIPNEESQQVGTDSAAGCFSVQEHASCGRTDIMSVPIQELDTKTHVTSTPSHIAETVLHTIPQPETTQSINHLSTEYLRCQYLETLYLSKTSLAFYAKGPLSRARARARLPDSSRSLIGLVEFYLESVVLTKRLDTKYKESLEQKLTRMASRGGDSFGNTAVGPPKLRRSKLGKDGLWPIEDKYIEQWWITQEFTEGLSQGSAQFTSEIKQLINKLRMRETEMQVLLILEILALQTHIASKKQTENADMDPNTNMNSEVPAASAGMKILDTKPNTVNPKLKRDLKSELDFLIDRLCIWHSIGLVDTIASTDPSCRDNSAEKLKDRLRDFGKDVIVPFYGAKLPELCHTICMKMGVVEVSPRRVQSSAGIETARKSSDPLVGRKGASSKRDLQNVLNEESGMRHASPPTLSRSATLPMGIDIKREPSERPMSRSSLQKSVSFSNREVDLVADARVTAAKRRRLDLVAVQKRELDAAIEALKKPNRSMAAKSFMDEVERRTQEDKFTLKHVDSVQISATPRRRKTERKQSDEYDLPPIPNKTIAQEGLSIPSSTTKVRGSSLPLCVPHSSAKKRSVLSAIHDTPSRGEIGRTKSVLQVDERHATSTSIPHEHSSSTLVTSTPVTSRLRIDLGKDIVVTPMRMNRCQKPVLLTPLERSEVSIVQAFRDAPEIPERAGKTMDRVMGSKVDTTEMSLYDSLGWNDDYDL